MTSQVLTAGTREKGKAEVIASPPRGWRSVAWFGGVLALIGFAEAAVYLYPWGFGSREWEFGATAQLLGSLPLPTIGIAALLAAAYALGSRGGLLATAILMGLIGVAIWALLVLFWLVVPLALKAPAAGQPVILQTIMRTTIAGVGFGVLYLGAAILTMRRVRGSQS